MNILFVRPRGMLRRSFIKLEENLKALNLHHQYFFRRGDSVEGTLVPDTLVRFGFTGGLPFYDYKVLNGAYEIQKISNKRVSRQVLGAVGSGGLVPDTKFSKECFDPCDFDNGAFWIGRPDHHARGRSIKIIRNMEDLERDIISTYWTRFIEKDEEYRIHIMHNKVLSVYRKRPGDRSAVAWNEACNPGERGWQLIRPANWPIGACLKAAWATHYIGADFAGVDVITKEDQAWVLELNSAPSITSATASLNYAKGFLWQFNGNRLPQSPLNEQEIFSEEPITWENVAHPALL